MVIYPLIRPLLFQMDPELAHRFAVKALRWGVYPPMNWRKSYKNLEQNIAGITFQNPIGLAAGFDKNAECIPALWRAGFGFLEVGTVTPKPQDGNPKPRIFRLTEDRAVINRLGFNNRGEKHLMSNIKYFLEHTENKAIFGINIGKNKNTEDPSSDYLHLLRELYGLSAYITINISSPNTPGLRSIQSIEMLENFLNEISQLGNRLAVEKKNKVPLFLKIAPDLSTEEISGICHLVTAYKVDGIIVSNTTISRPEGLRSRQAFEGGGLSGRPLFKPSTEALRKVYRFTEGKIPLIGVGGISSVEDVWEKMEAGASLVQLYSALVYEGLELIPRLLKELSAKLEKNGISHISEITGRKN